MLYLFGLVGLLAFDILFGCLDRRSRWREVASGYASIRTLRMLTGVTDRAELVRLFGSHGPRFDFSVTKRKVENARTPYRRVFDDQRPELVLAALAILIAIWSIFEPVTSFAWVVTCVAFLYLVVKSGYTLAIMLGCYRQMLEEGRERLRYKRLG